MMNNCHTHLLTSRIFVLLVLVTVFPGSVDGQNPQGEEQQEEGGGTERLTLGMNLGAAILQGDFAANVPPGGGHFQVGFDATGRISSLFGIRLAGGFINYGKEIIAVRLFDETDRVSSHLTTRNNILSVGIGPQVDFSTGRIRPYVNGFFGVGYFYTDTRLAMGGQDLEGSSTTNFNDWVMGYGIGGGVKIHVLKSRGVPIFISFDTQYRMHDQTEYLVEGSIVDDREGSRVRSLVSDADFFLIGLGVSVGLF